MSVLYFMAYLRLECKQFNHFIPWFLGSICLSQLWIFFLYTIKVHSVWLLIRNLKYSVEVHVYRKVEYCCVMSYSSSFLWHFWMSQLSHCKWQNNYNAHSKPFCLPNVYCKPVSCDKCCVHGAIVSLSFSFSPVMFTLKSGFE